MDLPVLHLGLDLIGLESVGHLHAAYERSAVALLVVARARRANTLVTFELATNRKHIPELENTQWSAHTSQLGWGVGEVTRSLMTISTSLFFIPASSTCTTMLPSDWVQLQPIEEKCQELSAISLQSQAMPAHDPSLTCPSQGGTR